MLISKEEYLPLSFSSIKAFAVSPLQFIHYKLHKPPPTTAMQFGTLVHLRLLEPDKFTTEVAVFDGRRDKRTAAYQEFLQDNPGAHVVNSQELSKIECAAGRLQYHTQAQELLDGLAEAEKPVQFEFEGVPFRGIVDGFAQGYLLDLKTSAKWTPDEFGRAFYANKYYWQAFLYQFALGFEDRPFYFIVMQSAEPFNVAVYKVEPIYFEMARQELRQIIGRWKRWNGKTMHLTEDLETHEILNLGPPHWARPQMFFDEKQLFE